MACQPLGSGSDESSEQDPGTTSADLAGDKTSDSDMTLAVGDLSTLSLPELLKLQEDGAITMDELTAELTRRLKEDNDFITATTGAPGPEGEPGPQGEPGLPIIWLGNYMTDPAEPMLNWAYYNELDGIAYVFDGTGWQILAMDGEDGAPGEKGDTGLAGVDGMIGPNGDKGDPGDDGADGISIVWKGSMAVTPANPEPNWAYYNTVAQTSYIYDGSSWSILASGGGGGSAIPGPVFTSEPVIMASLSENYSYNVTAIDQLGGTVRIILDQGPDGMAFDPLSGLLTWSIFGAKYNPVVLKAINEQGGVTYQSFDLVIPGRTYVGGTYVHDSDIFEALTILKDGSLLLAGQTGTDERIGWLVKIDDSGAEIWNKTYNGGYISDFTTLTDGSILIAGGEGYRGGLLVGKLDLDGNELWSKTYFVDAGSYAKPKDIQVLDDGTILLPFGIFGYTGSGLLKLDADGNEIWAKTFGSGDASDDPYEFNAMTVLADGNIFLCGDTYFSDAEGRNAWLVKTDSDGNELWSKTFGGYGDDYCHSMTILAGESILIVGTGHSSLWLVKTDMNGAELWSKTIDYNSFGEEFDRGFYEYGKMATLVLDDGTIMVAGESADNNQGFLSKLTAAGTLLWVEKYGGGRKTDNYDSRSTTRFNALAAHPNGTIYLVGETENFGIGRADGWLINIDEDGNVLW